MRMQLTFVSGAQIEVDTTNITIGRHPVTDQFARLKWVTPDDFVAKLMYLRVDDIVAVVALEDPVPTHGDERKARL